jgi:AraC-like DNA-binding protein
MCVDGENLPRSTIPQPVSERAAPTAGCTPGGRLVQRLSLRSNDVEHVRTFGGEHFFPRKFLHPLQRSGHLAARFDLLRLGALTICDAQYGADVSLGYEPTDAYQVSVPLAGRLTAHQGGRAIVGAGNLAPVTRVGEDVTLDCWGADCRQLVVKIERDFLERQLRDLLGAPIQVPIKLAGQLDTATGPGRTCAGLIRMVASEFSNETGMLDHPLVLKNLNETLTTALLFANDHVYRDALSRPAHAYRPPPVRRAIEAIESVPEHPYTMATLADAGGVSVRTLQAGFRRYVGITPMTYLRDVRLARAHEELRAGDPRHTTVAQIAYRWGFVHLGRFAAAYRARYHTTPSRTLHGH